MATRDIEIKPLHEKSQRELALDIVLAVLEKQKFSHVVLKETLDMHSYLEKNARGFITRLSEGTIEQVITLDYILNRFSKLKVKKMKPLIRNVLRISLYQIKYMDSIPGSAICNEAVKITKKRGFSNLSGFVNGILREILRHPEKLEIPDMTDEVQYLSTLYSVPEWLVKHFMQAYGEQQTKSILEGMQLAGQNSITTVRVNTSKISMEAAKEQLAPYVETIEVNPYVESSFNIKGYDMLLAIPIFANGCLQVQNTSSILVGSLSGVKKGDRCLDICSAPGGKSLHLADLLAGTGEVIARDLSQKKCDLIEENRARSSFTNMKIQVWDALKFDAELENSCDIVVADVPCSGLGVLAEKPDIKYRVQPEELQSLAELSKQILKNAYRYIKPGGTLLFSTCTMNPTENTACREWLLQEFPLKPIAFDTALTKQMLEIGNNRETAKKGYLELFTTDCYHGFFISKFIKV